MNHVASVASPPFVPEADRDSQDRSPGSAWRTLADGVVVHRAAHQCARDVLSPGAIALIARLHRALHRQRAALLAARQARQAAYDQGELPRFEVDHAVSTGDWRIAPLPRDLQRRRVEITGPANQARMVIKMLSRDPQGHRADTAMLDFEDAMKPTWSNIVDGVRNVHAVAHGTLEATKVAADGRVLRHDVLRRDDMALPIVRVRGLHLEESNIRVDGQPVAACIVDFALTMLHGAIALAERGTTPTFYIPKCEHRDEARWWNGLFRHAQRALALPMGTLRATFLIETLPAALQMESILFEVREHAAGLNVGRWDKIFSDIKVLMNHPTRILADRASIGMNRPWMRDYARLLVNTCHRRGALALGGMAAFTPGRDPATRRTQRDKVAADKHHEARLGHDGCWVSHPYFIPAALSAFVHDNQLGFQDTSLGEQPDLLPCGGGPYTLDGLRTNARVGIAYLEGWDHHDLGCIAWDDQMEDLATLEISRAQVGQWLRHGVRLDSGERVTHALVRRVFDEEHDRIQAELGTLMPDSEGPDRRVTFDQARTRAAALFTAETFSPFLTEASLHPHHADPSGPASKAIHSPLNPNRTTKEISHDPNP